MYIDLTNVSLENPSEWIKPVKNADGSYQTIKYTMKITEIAQDGYNAHGDEKFKITFKTSDQKMFAETFAFTENVLWKLKRLVVAMKAPDKLDLSQLVDRYVVGILTGRLYNGKDYNEIIGWEYATQNDKLPAITEAKPEAEVIAEEAELAF